MGSHPQPVPFGEKNDCVIGPAESRGALDQRVQHGLDVRRRLADHAEDLARRCLLLQRLGQLSVGIGQLLRACFHFLLQVRSVAFGPVYPGFDLVACAQLDRLVERPSADPRRAFLEHADRRDHSPGQENAGQHREPEAQHEDDGAPDDRSPERSVGGGGGTLDEDEPPEGSNRGVGRQHPPAPETLCDHGHRSARPGRFHLGQAGEIPLQPQHPIVRVGHELVTGIHHVGVPVRADLDLGNDLLHSAEADLGRGHLDSVLAPRHRQRHVRLRLVLEVDGTPVRLARSRLHELGRPGEVLLTSHNVQPQARNAKLLLAGQVEMAELAHGGDVAKDSEEVELALLGHGRAQSLAKAQLGWSHLAGVGIVGRGPGRLAHL